MPIAAARYAPLFIGLSCLLPSFATGGSAPSLSNAVAIVDYDEATERKLGEFPSRLTIARIIDAVASAKPRSIALKFYFDSAGNADHSQALEQALQHGGRVLLQATVHSEPPTSRSLDERFFFTQSASPVKPTLDGVEGWLPLARFSSKAAKVCFVNIADPARPGLVPMVTLFRGRPVESLWACILADAFGDGRMTLQEGRAVFGPRQLAIDKAGQATLALREVNDSGSVSAFDLLEGKVDGKLLKDKVVVIIYTGARSPTLDVRGQPVKIHQLFVAQLREMMGALGTGPAPAPDPPLHRRTH